MDDARRRKDARLKPHDPLCPSVAQDLQATPSGRVWAATPAGLKAMEELEHLEDGVWRCSGGLSVDTLAEELGFEPRFSMWFSACPTVRRLVDFIYWSA